MNKGKFMNKLLIAIILLSSTAAHARKSIFIEPYVGLEILSFASEQPKIHLQPPQILNFKEITLGHLLGLL